MMLKLKGQLEKPSRASGEHGERSAECGTYPGDRRACEHRATRQSGGAAGFSSCPQGYSSAVRAASTGWVVLMLAACAGVPVEPTNTFANAALTPNTRITRDLMGLPEPKGKVVVAVYGFRDQTGQYKPAPDSSFSTAVTQGASSLLVKALKDSGWFIPVEREGLQNLLTERKIVRALENPGDSQKANETFPALLPATILIEGGLIAYESNVRTGGSGARYIGIGGKTQYRVDQVTLNLRSVDIRDGHVMNSVLVTKTIYSYELSAGVFKYVSFQHLLEAESGFTQNEPVQLAIKEAIESAVIHLTVQGLKDQVWSLKKEGDWNNKVIRQYLGEADAQLGLPKQSEAEIIGIRPPLAGQT